MQVVWGALAIIGGAVVLRFRRVIARSDIDHQVALLRGNRLVEPSKSGRLADVLDSTESRRFQVWLTTAGGIALLVVGTVILIAELT